MHTAPHPALPEPVRVALDQRHEAADDEGRECAWEEEGLWLGPQRILGHEAPDAADWCADPSDHWATVDVLGQDGPFVSVYLQGDDNPARCETWDVTRVQPASLVDYDSRHAEKRVKRALATMVRRGLPAHSTPTPFSCTEATFRSASSTHRANATTSTYPER